MTDLITVNDLIYMLKREVEHGNGDKYVKIPKSKLKDIKETNYSSDIGIVYGQFHNKGDCIILHGD